MFDVFRADLERYRSLSPVRGLRSVIELVETQGVWAIACYRFGRWSYHDAAPAVRAPLKLTYRIANKLVEMATGIQLPARAEIGAGLYIGHFGGIIVHPDTVMGRGCSISHGVTIGELGNGRPDGGVPRMGNDVYIGAGAKVLGAIAVGDGAAIGANAVVLRDVPAHATAVGVPARIVGVLGAK